ncbi:protease synthase and sporulation protein PAI 2 [Phocicoccus schoeneichii]|uniref:Protease synthase and sporulation protein PAI 2 n=1 Tax=Phocicoccus schoeneichii TaxID=1812261 RepID=A0A6V7RA42_9BACL|nr:FMN-binding negative transcriptional regulator [Jeotgalicoccus schoeneichii]GGH53022.1 protease synthase and sporulation protein PAI 2 [Jeotgalicoccus schoeneichii]CAD2074136.1 Protease synthase and sporulation protein PAI 2 [Jeotgalicoccus schoeneichii]
MFIPKHFKVTDFDEIKGFIQSNSFGIVVTTKQGKPIATHLPLELHKQGDNYYITGHMAYANPQWKTIEVENENVLVIYQGPHAYISSSWYKHENVPTWNYQSVHIYGTASIMSEQELEEDLRLLLQKYERHRKNAVLWEKLSPQTKKQIKGIVGFKIKIEEVQAAYKLSQNRNDEDYHNIIDKLNEEEDLNSHQVAEVMKNRE